MNGSQNSVHMYAKAMLKFPSRRTGNKCTSQPVEEQSTVFADITNTQALAGLEKNDVLVEDSCSCDSEVILLSDPSLLLNKVPLSRRSECVVDESLLDDGKKPEKDKMYVKWSSNQNGR